MYLLQQLPAARPPSASRPTFPPATTVNIFTTTSLSQEHGCRACSVLETTDTLMNDRLLTCTTQRDGKLIKFNYGPTRSAVDVTAETEDAQLKIFSCASVCMRSTFFFFF